MHVWGTVVVVYRKLSVFTLVLLCRWTKLRSAPVSSPGVPCDVERYGSGPMAASATSSRFAVGGFAERYRLLQQTFTTVGDAVSIGLH